jgi:thymidine kinase
MSLELLIGPMFAGKSSAIQSIVRRHQALGWQVFVVTNTLDTRYSSEPAIVNHDRLAMPALAAASLMPLLSSAEYRASRLVVVEEAQFFSDLITFIHNAVDVDGKHAVVVGLDGDAERRPFGQVLELVPLCDRVTKMTAFCKQCADGTPALFTFDTFVPSEASPCDSDTQIKVGGGERFLPLCRKCFLLGKQGLL